MGPIKIRKATIGAVIQLVTGKTTRLQGGAGINEAIRARATSLTGSIVNRLREGIRRLHLQAAREPSGQTQLKRVVGRLGRGLILNETSLPSVRRDALKGRAQAGVLRRVGRDDGARHCVDDRMLDAGERRLVDRHLSQKFQSARAHVRDFQNHVIRDFELNAGVVLLDIWRAHVAIKSQAKERHARNQLGKLALRVYMGEGIIERQRWRESDTEEIQRRRE